MFANGGGANQGYVTSSSGTRYYDPLSFSQTLSSLTDSELFALHNSAATGEMNFSPELFEILDKKVAGKEIPLFSGSPVSRGYTEIGQDFGRTFKGLFGPVISGGVRAFATPDSLKKSEPFYIPGYGDTSFSLKDIADYDSPFYGEDGLEGFNRAAVRGGRSEEELDAILGGGLEQIQDFQSEINGFVGPTRPSADVVDTAKVTEVSGPSGPTPITTSETLSIEGGPGSLEARRLAYEKDMIGRDEFGNLLPEGRLEQDDEIATLLDEIKPIEQKVDVDKTEADTLAENAAKFGGLSQDEFRATIDDAAIPKLPEIEMPIVGASIEEQEELRKQNDPISRKLDQPGFFGSDRFLNFIRNVGGELTRTGQMGAGLAGGASKAAEERAARELMADKEERDYRMKLRLAKAEADLEARNKAAEGIKPSDIKTFTGFEDDIGNALSQFDESERIVSDINQILNVDIKEPGAFGARGFLSKISDKLRNAAGYGETAWENLDPAVKTQVILDVTAQRSVRQILGESGKTISNLDRDIVARIFGNVNIWTSPAELSKLLTNSRDNIVESMRKDQSTVISRANAIGQGGYNSPALMANESLINRILGFSFDDIENYKLGENAAGYIETTL
jgi:hypothetical protein